MTIERRPLGENGHVLVDTALEEVGFVAAFTERTGGESTGSYSSLNLSYTVDDEEGSVRRNRDVVSAALGIGAFATAEQIHGAKLVRVGQKRASAGHLGPSDRIRGADAMSTASPGVALAILTADCVPMVAASASEGLLVVAHLGWRGLAAGLVVRAVAAFDDPKSVRVALGPAIGPDHYEVGPDVALAVASGTEAGAVTERRQGGTFLDLVGTVRRELRALGIRRVEDTGVCTMCEEGRVFSYRRDEIIACRLAG